MVEVKDVCTLQGPGYGECWGCPVKACPLWSDPSQFLSHASEEVALSAARKLRNNEFVVGGRGQSLAEELGDTTVDTALSLMFVHLSNPEVQAALRTRMAAEAIYQNVYIPGRDAAERDIDREYIRRATSRVTTPDDEAWYEEARDHAASRAARKEYDAESDEAVYRELQYLKGLVPKATDLYRKDHAHTV